MRSLFIPFILVILLIGAGLLYPNWKNLKAQKTTLSKLSEDLKAKTEDLKRLSQQEEEEVKALNNLARSIPQKLNQAELIRDMNTITKKHSFSFDGVQFSRGVQASSNTPELSISLNAEGAWEKTTAFLEAFEQNDPFIGLKTLQVSVDKTGASPQASLGLSLYTLSLR